MSIELKRKQLKESFYCLKVGYCELERELNPFIRFGYVSGTYGWCCDCYQFQNIALTTGYNPEGKRVSDEGINRIKEAFEMYRDSDYFNFDFGAYYEEVYHILLCEVMAKQ